MENIKAPLAMACVLLLFSLCLAFAGAYTMPHAFQQPFLLTALAGLATGLGSLIYLWIDRPSERHLILALGLSAGAMLYVSFAELLRSAVDTLGFVQANVLFFVGFLVMWLLDSCLPHHYLAESHGSAKQNRLLSTGKLVAVGLAIHNFPEGMAVFISGASDHTLGMALALTIALHNIPEGIAVAAPVYHATGNRWQAFLWSYASGIAEPLGALLALYFLHAHLTENITSICFALVAGIMTFVSFDELLPAALRQPSLHQTAMVGIGLGMLLLMLSLAVF